MFTLGGYIEVQKLLGAFWKLSPAGNVWERNRITNKILLRAKLANMPQVSLEFQQNCITSRPVDECIYFWASYVYTRRG